MMFAIVEHAQDWYEHLPHILFGYRCGVQANIHFSPHMIITSWIPRLWVGKNMVRCLKSGIWKSIIKH